MLRVWFVSVVSALLISGAPTPQAEVAGHWRALALIDVDAAYRLLLADHPGASPEAGDAAFRARLEAAHVSAVRRASAVRSPEGYTATLAAFAVAMGDKHIYSRPLVQTDSAQWAGIVTACAGANGRWRSTRRRRTARL